jgi:hypothetical protein
VLRKKNVAGARPIISPAQRMLGASRSGWQARRIEDEASRTALLAETGQGVVAKKGVHANGAYFSDPALVGGRKIEYRLHPDSGKLVIYSLDDPQEYICVALNLDRLDEVEQESRARAATQDWQRFSSSVRKTAREAVKGLSANPAEILLSGASRETIEVPAIAFTTRALEEVARANAAAAAIGAVPSVDSNGGNVVRLPLNKREDDLPGRRRASYERLKKLAPENLSEADRRWLAVYEEFGDDFMGIGRTA